ncbi:hypothetical protein BH10ACT10_BH10ACT10_17750 [soil metagenome]
MPGLTVHSTGTFAAVFMTQQQGTGRLVHFAGHDDLDQTFSVVGGTVPFRTGVGAVQGPRGDRQRRRHAEHHRVRHRAVDALRPHGKALARNPGQVRYEILVDDNGTPSLPDDDEFLAYVGPVKDSTGRNDDYCAAMVGYLGLG